MPDRRPWDPRHGAADDVPRVGVVLVSWEQSEDDLRFFFAQLEKLTWSSRKTWLVNNKPGRDLSTFSELSQIVDSPSNLGWTGGANLGAKAALDDGCTHVLFMNTDVKLLHDDLVQSLLYPFEREARCGLASPGIVLWPNEHLIWYRGGRCRRPFWVPRHPGIGRPWKAPNHRMQPTDIVVGCCVLVSADVLRDTGGFDEQLFMYFDDPDLSVRAREAGYQCFLVDEPLMAHAKTGRSLSPLEAFYFGRNAIIVATKHEAGLRRAVALGTQLAVMPGNLWRADSTRSRKEFVRGTIEGLRMWRRVERAGVSTAAIRQS